LGRKLNKLTGIRQWKEEALWDKILDKSDIKLENKYNYWAINTDKRRSLVLTKSFVKVFFKCNKRSEIISYLGEMAMYSNPLKYLERFIEEPYFEADTSHKCKRKVIVEKSKNKK
jgi:hypothetical protein